MEMAKSEDGNGGFKLPIGFRFHPTDEEVVLHYLKRKVFSQPLPVSVIPHFDVFHLNPWDLPGERKEKRYFFCKRSWNSMKNCSSSLRSDCGCWKATGKHKQIMAPGTNLLIGIKKSFVFYRGRNLQKTRWILQEFCLVTFNVNTPLLSQRLMMQVGDWVVCRVYQRQRRAKNKAMFDINTRRKWTGITACDCPNLRIGRENGLGISSFQDSPSPCSSEVTEVR